MLPLAPGLFSTITVCLSASESGCEIARAMMSDEPPGVYGTMIRIVLPGQACADAGGGDGEREAEQDGVGK